MRSMSVQKLLVVSPLPLPARENTQGSNTFTLRFETIENEIFCNETLYACLTRSCVIYECSADGFSYKLSTLGN